MSQPLGVPGGCKYPYFLLRFIGGTLNFSTGYPEGKVVFSEE
jgi:hypothetical protein